MEDEAVKKKSNYVGAPAIFLLELECKHIRKAFGSHESGCYLVGSAIARPDWRDVDVRFILTDKAFADMFPDACLDASQFDTRWLLINSALSERLSRITGLPIDFQFQPQTYANVCFDGERHALGITVGK